VASGARVSLLAAFIGAAITAAVSVGYFKSFEEACENVVWFRDEVYQKMYYHNKELFWRLPL